MLPILLVFSTVSAAELIASFDPVLALDAQPELRFELVRHPAAVLVECEVAGQTRTWEFEEVPAGRPQQVQLPYDPKVTSALCQILARFENGHSEGVDVPMAWRYQRVDPEVDPNEMIVDPIARTATLPAPFEAKLARVVAIDADGQEMFEELVSLRARGDRVTVRWSTAGAEQAARMRIELEGGSGETVAYDLQVERK
jgi:hypothetical protein